MTNYAYSIKTSRVREPDFPYQGQQISCTSELVDFVKMLQSSDIEKFISIHLDTQNKVICLQIINGTVNQATVYPREVIRHALLSGATALILVHNHPSGNIQPSESDIKVTRIITEAAKLFEIVVHDHVIVGENYKSYSFRDSGMMPL